MIQPFAGAWPATLLSPGRMLASPTQKRRPHGPGHTADKDEARGTDADRLAGLSLPLPLHE